MSDSLITFSAIVMDVLPGGKCRVQFVNGHQAVADPAIPSSTMPGVGEHVLVEISFDDTATTRSVFRRAIGAA